MALGKFMSELSSSSSMTSATKLYVSAAESTGSPILKGTIEQLAAVVMPDTIRVTDATYGVVGDGMTDDTNSMQTALNAAQDKIVYIPGNKTYVFGPLSVKTGTQILFGPNVRIERRTTGSTSPLFTLVDDAEDVVFASMSIGASVIDLNRASIASRGIYALRSHRLVVKGLMWLDAGGHFIHTDDAHDARVEDCFFTGSDDTSLQFYVKSDENCEGCRVIRCKIDRTGDGDEVGGCIKFSWSTDGVSPYGVINDPWIVECHGIMDLMPGGIDPVVFEVWSPGQGAKILGATTYGGGIAISIANQHTDFLVAMFRVESADAIGVEAADANSGSIGTGVVEGNWITDTGVSLDGTNHGAQNITVANVTINRCSSRGVSLWSGAHHACLGSLTIYHPASATSGEGCAIFCEGCDDVTAEGLELDGGGVGHAGLLVRNSSRFRARFKAIGFTHPVQVIANGQTVNECGFEGHAYNCPSGVQFLEQSGGIFQNLRVAVEGSQPYGYILNSEYVYNTASYNGYAAGWTFFRGFISDGATPESRVTANKGSILTCSDGNVYRKGGSDNTNTGWATM